MKLVWACSWDGKVCEYVRVNVKDGVIIQPDPISKDRGIYAPNSWDTCVNCPHSGSISVSMPRLCKQTDDGRILNF